MKNIYLLVVFVVLSLVVPRTEAANCMATASLSARDTSTDSRGRTNTLYDISVTNVGTCILSGVKLAISLPSGAAVTHLSNLEVSIGGPFSSSSAFNLLNFGDTIAAGASFNGATFTLATKQAAPSIAISASGECGSECPADNMPSDPALGEVAGRVELDESFQLRLRTAATQARRFDLLKDKDFVFDFTTATVEVSESDGGRTIAATPNNFPALIGHNIAMTVGFIGPCGINLPHTHPRATEINFIVSGSFEAGLFMENGVRFVGNNLTAGMVTVFPQGAIHFEQNMNCEPAVFVAAFNNEDPGVQTTGSSFFGLPVDIAAASLNIPVKTVEDLLPLIPRNPALGVEECRRRCGLN